MTYSSLHHTFVIERLIAAPPALVFFAWADGAAKAQWFSGPNDWSLIERVHDFREGGVERLKGRWPSGKVADFQCRFHDIVPDKRIVYSYDMYHDDRRLSVSLATLDLKPESDGTRLTLTEQITHLDGYPTPEDREEGTRHLIERAAAFIEAQTQ
ncbi:SRPBCC family protein [Asticcacaulis sp. EMRT-3]|uniref:SRPBCC family protein n=1 Tax=Asticcacaulis sp. EMRT-3 TaxID=3040349 RepID=UPI0024AF9E1E|nr:SRPBCC family protein [Asticcacaulis sp. EMRT-3]MDI7775556.1 SRPBCC family protein [Asticcacaulis sp. EMRT-3]